MDFPALTVLFQKVKVVQSIEPNTDLRRRHRHVDLELLLAVFARFFLALHNNLSIGFEPVAR